MTVEEVGAELVSIETLKQDPTNPRRISGRDLERLQRSLVEDPDFMRLRPILARPDGTVYAGNMRLEAARALGWKEVWAVITDDPEALVRKRAVKDNTQFGEWVEEELAEYLTELAAEDTDLDVGALGLDNVLMAGMGLEHVIESMPDFPDMPPPLAENAAQGGPGAAGMNRPNYDNDESSKTLDEASGKLEGVLQLSEGMIFNGSNAWDIPALREDMMLTPDDVSPMKTWSDQKTTPPEDGFKYLWNWGLSPATGLPMDRAMLTFYTWDHHFENWWSLPAYYTAKVLNSGIRMAMVPDFSLYGDMPKALTLLNVFRAQWLGRYFQEAGIRVMPRLNWGNEDSYDFTFLGIPRNCEVAGICLQTFFTKQEGETEVDKHRKLEYAENGLRAAMEIVAPQALLNYGGPPAHRFVKELNLGVPVMDMMNYSGVRRGVAYDKGAAHTDTVNEVNPNLGGTGAVFL